MKKVLIILFVFFLSVLPATARELLTPNPSIKPARVVELQLQALQQNDNPMPDFGIAQTWMFAHPSNKRLTGPIERFATMIKGPNYQMMINHRKHKIKSVVLTDNYALFEVLIATKSEFDASFKWEVSKVKYGPHQGSWMTTTVSPPLRIKGAV